MAPERAAGTRLAAFVLVGLGAPLGAQTLIADIRPGTPDPSPGNPSIVIRSLGNRAILFAADTRHGLEPWVTDGTAAGTSLVKDVHSGSAGSVQWPTSARAWNGAVYFSATTERGLGLWRTDGTAAGTFELRGNLNVLAWDVDTFVPGPGGLYFAASDGIAGGELWVTDGTPAGTRMVADVNPGPANAMQLSLSPTSMCAVGGTLYFVANDGSHGYEIWRTDGTAANTSLLVDLAAGATDSSPRTLVELGGALLFTSSFSGSGRWWWRSDGTVVGTTVVSFTHVLSQSPSAVFVHNGRVFFQGLGTGNEPWVTDGTAAGTVQLADIYAGNGYSAPEGFTRFANEVWFTARSNAYGYELWHSDGTPAGTSVIDIVPGAAGTRPTDLEEWSGALWFAGRHASDGIELWRSDGTLVGTTRVADIRSGSSSSSPIQLTAIGTALVFAADDGVHGVEPFATYGTAATTALLADIAGTSAGSSIERFASIRGKAYFTADDGTSGIEPWISDGTPAGTMLLRDTRPGPTSTSIGSFVPYRDAVWFAAAERLWRSDGTPGGTTIPFAALAVGTELAATHDRLLFAGPSLGLWSSDGSVANTALVISFNSGLRPMPPQRLVSGGDVVWFLAGDGLFSPGGLWRSDGSLAGTVLMHPMVSQLGTSPVAEMVAADGRLWFTLNDGGFASLRVASGSGSIEVYREPLPPIFAIVPPLQLCALGSRMYFAGSDATHGRELWGSDGSPAGTALLADLRPGAASGSPRALVAAGGRVFFGADDGVAGDELWITDGSIAGTRLVVDATPGPAGSSPAGLRAAGDGARVVFRANGGAGGPEPWFSDGSAAGTLRIADIAPGGAGSAPVFGAVTGTTQLFRADDGLRGDELWGVPLALLGATLARPYGTPCPGTGGLSPRIGALGLPTVGNANFAATLRDARPLSAAATIIGLDVASTPLAPGCTLLVGNPIVFLGANTDANGRATVSLAVPATPALAGASLVHQFAIADPFGAYLGAVALSDGLLELIGL